MSADIFILKIVKLFLIKDNLFAIFFSFINITKYIQLKTINQDDNFDYEIITGGTGPGSSSCLVYGNQEKDCGNPEISMDKLPKECSSIVYDGLAIDPDNREKVIDTHGNEDTRSKKYFYDLRLNI